MLALRPISKPFLMVSKKKASISVHRYIFIHSLIVGQTSQAKKLSFKKSSVVKMPLTHDIQLKKKQNQLSVKNTKKNWHFVNVKKNEIDQINKLCKLLLLGDLITPPKRVNGIFINSTWHIETSCGEYAVKKIGNADVIDEGSRREIEKTEGVSKLFAEKGIRTVTNVMHRGHSLINIDDQIFRVRPWIKGDVLHKDSVSQKHAQKIAILVAALHNLNLSNPGFDQLEWDIHSNEYFQRLVHASMKAKLPFAENLRENLPKICSWNECYQQSIQVLNQHAILSHGDIDQRNVVWQQNLTPILIDWESARLLNPTAEMIAVALDWSGINSQFNFQIFEKMLSTYLVAGGTMKNYVREAFFGLVGNRLHWMAFNIERCLSKDTILPVRRLSIEHVPQLLNMLVYLTSHIPTLAEKTQQILNPSIKD